MRRLALLSVIALLAAGGCHRQAPPEPQAQPADNATTTAEAPGAQTPPQHMPDAAAKGKALPTATIKDPADAEVKVSDLKGKPMLVNLWATWCVPCVKELPTLDKLAAATAGKLQVVAVSEDLEGRRVVEPFFKQHGYAALKPYTDPSNALLLKLGEAGLPVTILYDAQGKEVWRMRGDMDWTGSKAQALLAEVGV